MFEHSDAGVLHWWRWRQAQWKDFGDKWSSAIFSLLKKMHKWEDAVASSFGNEAGDGHPSHVKHQRDGWIWLRIDSCGQLS